MWASRIYLRWYKSFNTRYHGYIENADGKPWETRNGEFFPYVEIPLDRRISTIVGANESGKSHLLSAIEKIFNGWSTGLRYSRKQPKEEYDLQHVCRYCALDGLEADTWPCIGVELSFDNKAQYDHAVNQFGVTPASLPTTDLERRLSVFIDGSRSGDNWATFYDHNNQSCGQAPKEKWFDTVQNTLPSVHFIDSQLRLSNEVHVTQLEDMYEERKPSTAYDPLALHELTDALLSVQLNPKEPPGEAINAITEIRDSLGGRVLGPRDSLVRLETLLFDDILGIDADTLGRIKELGAGNRGYVERIIEEINHRLIETLDISQFWQQDDDFQLQVEYKGGFFYFLITDKTGATYTFNERSSGLRFFLSYYIQAKAIKQSVKGNGAIVLMDEPDSFLSAAAQRNLLQVFESLIQPSADTGAVQLVYTTHSPFLINRNFPQRISLVRKGDGSEGTQLVEGSSTRRYEPIRSGLGIDCAETLFMGTMNVVLEGISDQKVLVAAIQRFGNPAKIDELLDLNKVTFVSADGVSNVPRLIAKSTAGAEKRPVVVTLLDGDAPGQTVAQNLEAEKLLDKDFIATLDQVGLKPAWNPSPKELEDIVPPKLMAVAVARYLANRWNEQVDTDALEQALTDSSNGDTMAKRLIKVTKDRIGGVPIAPTKIEIKGGVFDAFVETLADGCDFSDNGNVASEVAAFADNIRLICTKLQELLSVAETRSRRDRLQKNVRLAIERFEKSHRLQATKADVERALQRIDDECNGGTEHARLSRENVIQLRLVLDEEVVNAGETVDIERWLRRLRLLWDSPWRKEKGGWEKV